MSQDCSTFVTRGLHADTANVDIDLTGTGLTFVKCVRFITHPEMSDPGFPKLGFDLDAIEALHSLPDP